MEIYDMQYLKEEELKEINCKPLEYFEEKFGETLYDESTQKCLLEDLADQNLTEYVKCITGVIKESRHNFKELSGAAMQKAASNGNIEIMTYLADEGADISIAKKNGTDEIKQVIADRERKAFSEKLGKMIPQATKQNQSKLKI